jgi:N-methylhydantoinase B
MEGIYEALSKASGTLAPAGSAADICGVLIYGRAADGEMFAVASPMPVGHGAHSKGDGATLHVHGLAQSTLTGAERTPRVPASTAADPVGNFTTECYRT